MKPMASRKNAVVKLRNLKTTLNSNILTGESKIGYNNSQLFHVKMLERTKFRGPQIGPKKSLNKRSKNGFVMRRSLQTVENLLYMKTIWRDVNRICLTKRYEATSTLIVWY